MTRALPRTNFNSSGLIRILSELSVAENSESPANFAERLSGWFDVTDAITLSAALGQGGTAQIPSGRPGQGGAALAGEVERVRAALGESIMADGVSRPGKLRIKSPLPTPGTDLAAADFSPWHRFYQAYQREMESNVGLLRAHARAALAGRSPAHRQIAALDTALGKVLSDRERSLLGSVPALLEKRFAQLHQAHLAARGDSQATDDPLQWAQPGGWLAVFCRDLQRTLLAELDVRLQPVIGLIEALGNEVTELQ